MLGNTRESLSNELVVVFENSEFFVTSPFSQEEGMMIIDTSIHLKISKEIVVTEIARFNEVIIGTNQSE